MMPTAHTWILRAAQSRNPSCPTDVDAERFVISAGYAVYTQKPLMKLTREGYRYAERNQRFVGRKAG